VPAGYHPKSTDFANYRRVVALSKTSALIAMVQPAFALKLLHVEVFRHIQAYILSQRHWRHVLSETGGVAIFLVWVYLRPEARRALLAQRRLMESFVPFFGIPYRDV
jgi:hypothetical protein